MFSVARIWHSSTGRTWLAASVLAASTLAVFAPALDCGWTNYDDHNYVTENLHVTEGLSGKNFYWALTTNHNANWHPLTWLSLQLDAMLWGQKAFGFHLTNILFHAANAALLLVALQALTGAFWRSLAVALLFAVHPLRAESVAWVSERKDVLSVFFGLAALWAYAVYVRRPSTKGYIPVALALALSLMCKPTLVTLPCLLLVLDWWPLRRTAAEVPPADSAIAALTKSSSMRRLKRTSLAPVAAGAKSSSTITLPPPQTQSASLEVDPRPSGMRIATGWRRLVMEKMPLFALVAISAVMTVRAQAAGGAVMDFKKFPLPLRLENAAMSYVIYLGKMAWPLNLAPYYLYPEQAELDAAPWKPIGAVLFLIAVTVTAVMLRRRAPYLPTGWLWYFGTLVPAIGLVQVGNQAMADRYTYFPQIGILVALCWGVTDLAVGRLRQRSLIGAVGLVALLLAALTARQVTFWHDSITLWNQAFVATGGSETDMLKFGGAIEDAGKWDDAAEWYRRILERFPLSARAYMNLGVLASEQGNQQAACQLLGESLAIDPHDPLTHTNLGNVYFRMERFEDAKREHEFAVETQPLLWGAWRNLGLVEKRLGNTKRAAECYRKAIRLRPDFAEVHSMLGGILLEQGEEKEGFAHLQAAVRFDPDYADGHINLGKALANRNRLDEASKEFEKAIKIVKVNHLQQAMQLRTSQALAWWNLGAARFLQQRVDEAVECVMQAVELDPTNSQYRGAVQDLLQNLKKSGRLDLAGKIEDLLRRLDGHKTDR